MANVVIAILIFLILLVVSIGTVSLIVIVLNADPDVNVVEQPCDQGSGDLFDVSENPCYRDIDGNCRLVKYTSEILNGTYLFPFPVPYLQVCNSLCSGFVDSSGNCCSSGDPECVDLISDYHDCVSALEPIDCQGEALPVAIDGNVLFYAGLLASENVDPLTCDCVSV